MGLELFVLGSIWFWLCFVAVPVVIIAICFANSNTGLATLFTIGPFVGVALLTDFHFSSIWHHPWWTVIFIGAYVVAGAVWATIKWYTLCKDALKNYNNQSAQIRKNWDDTSETYKKGITYAAWVNKNYNFPPAPSQHKEDIYMWLMWWPLSIVGTLIGDYILRFAKFLYEHLATTFQRISNHVFAGTDLNR